MIPAALLPPIQKPPHDPSALILTLSSLWPGALSDNLRLDRRSRRLRLDYASGFRHTAADPNGTFGGLVLPSNVAVAPDGGIYLLDRGTATLKRFDPCECRFETVPCFGGIGGKARELRNPEGLGICDGNLFVCDTGAAPTVTTSLDCNSAAAKRQGEENHRLTVMSLRSFTLRGHWSPPRSAYEGLNPRLAQTWEPFDVAFDGQGGVYVSDPANGCIHRFSPRGVWLAPLRGLGRVSHLAIDCRDRIYAVVEDAQTVKVLDSAGAVIDEIRAATAWAKKETYVRGPEEFSTNFPCLAFPVDHKGQLHLGDRCEPSCCLDRRRAAKEQGLEFGVFDLSGHPVDFKLEEATPKFEEKGWWISRALNSELYRCVWHRAVLRAQVPAGTSIEVATVTSEIEHSPADIKAMFEQQAFSARLTPNASDNNDWDALVRSPAGRYLWIKLTFRGNGSASPALEEVQVEFPRVSLRRYLPAVFGEEPTSADFTDRFLSIFDTTFRSIESTLDNLACYFDPNATPAVRRGGKIDFLSWLASWIGVTFDRNWPEQKRRRFLKQAGKLFPLRGTPKGLWRELLLYLGIEPERICCANDQPQDRCSPAPRNCAPIVKQCCHWQPPALILEHFRLRRWLFLGQGRLHDRAVLWGKSIVNRTQLDNGQTRLGKTQLIMRPDPVTDPFHVNAHQFTVFVPAKWKRSDAARKGLENLLKAESPAHTRYNIEYVEPHFRIGFQSTLGFNTAIGRWPQGVTLDRTRLRHGSVLSASAQRRGNAGIILGKQSRIGTTTELH